MNAHGKSGKFLKDSRTMSCETCHGDAANHIASQGKPNTIENPAKWTAARINQTCLDCHSRDRHVLNWQGGEHDRKDMSCLSCHTNHHPGLLKNMSAAFAGRADAEVAQTISARLPEKMLVNSTVEETCLRCHSDIRKNFLQRSTHLFRTELRNQKVGCASCHNPHGGEGDKMLVSPSVNSLCYSCHAEKRGPFLWEHPPARENCMVCHSPHGSNNTKLLTARVHMLCQQCHIHMLPRHSTTAGRPLDIWSINRGCINCHSQVHGSNHPGGRTFTR
ncbi:MAG: hypothetical protein ICV60_11250 [Pyrinomonadaceae bacterium]|nr:hypothetical protein [Pyrinomonadaceae bacterium]